MRLHLGSLFKLRVGSLAIFRESLQQMWSVTDRPAKRLMIGALLLMLGSSIVAALSPLLLKVLVEALDLDRDHTVDIAPIYLIIAYASAHWLSRSLGELREKFLGWADQRVQRQLSNKFFRHVMSLPLRFHLNRNTGALSQTLTNGLLGYRIVLQHLVNSILPILIEVATMGTILVFLGYTVFLVIMALSVLAYALAFWIGAIRISSQARNASAAQIGAGAVFTDSILNFETVKYFNGESQVHGRLMAALKNTENRWTELYTRKMENSLVIATIFALSLGISMYVAAGAVRQGDMSVGEFVLVNAYVIQLTRPLEMIGFAFRDIVQGVAFIERMAGLLHEKPELNLAMECEPISIGCGDLVFDNVSFGYVTDRHILQNVSFVVPPGKTLAIVGASGSGKSSLIRLLLRLLEPTKGQICLGGVPLSNIPISSLRDAVAVVPQDTALFNDSIAYNIAFGRQSSTHKEIVAAARIANIHNFILELSDGYDTKVGERGVKLSGGEKQRLAIARAAIKKPEIFVFDEATSSLDSKTERAILNNLVKIAENTTAIIIAHRLSTVVHADEIVVLDNGRVLERGTHDALMQQGGAYAAMWRAQHEEIYQFHDVATFASRA
jgi:ATP-binding cassette subfamily B protein